MRRGPSWIIKSALAFIGSFVAGWFLPDGLNWLVDRLGEEQFEVSPLIRFFSFLISFVIVSSVELLLWTRRELASGLDAIRSEVQGAVAAAIPTAVGRGLSESAVLNAQGAVLAALVPVLTRTPADGPLVAGHISRFSAVLQQVPEGLLHGYSVIVDRELTALETRVSGVANHGHPVDIVDHVEMTRQLAQRSRTFTQINRRAFQVPEEWTAEWIRLVAELGQRPELARTYIVLISEAQITVQSGLLARMDAYLRNHNWDFKVCAEETIQDSLGGTLPTDQNIDAFDGGIVKLQAVPSGRYRGGIMLTLTLTRLGPNSSLQRFIRSVVDNARPL